MTTRYDQRSKAQRLADLRDETEALERKLDTVRMSLATELSIPGRDSQPGRTASGGATARPTEPKGTGSPSRGAARAASARAGSARAGSVSPGSVSPGSGSSGLGSGGPGSGGPGGSGPGSGGAGNGGPGGSGAGSKGSASKGTGNKGPGNKGPGNKGPGSKGAGGIGADRNGSGPNGGSGRGRTAGHRHHDTGAGAATIAVRRYPASGSEAAGIPTEGHRHVPHGQANGSRRGGAADRVARNGAPDAQSGSAEWGAADGEWGPEGAARERDDAAWDWDPGEEPWDAEEGFWGFRKTRRDRADGWYDDDPDDVTAQQRTEELVSHGRRASRPGRRLRRRLAIGAAAVAALLALVLGITLAGGGASWPASVATVQGQADRACQNPDVRSEPDQVNFACAKATRQVLWIFALMTSFDNPHYANPKNGRVGLEPITPDQGGEVAMSLNLHHPYNPLNPVDSLSVAARAINSIIGGATVTLANGTPQVQPGLEGSGADCLRYTGSAALTTRAGFPSICARPVSTVAGQAALAADAYLKWMVGATPQAAADVAVLFRNAGNPGDPQAQAIVQQLRKQFEP